MKQLREVSKWVVALAVVTLPSILPTDSRGATCYPTGCSGAYSYEVRCEKSKEELKRNCDPGRTSATVCNVFLKNAEENCGCAEACRSKCAEWNVKTKECVAFKRNDRD
jgi:hypothetical protein